MVVSRKVLTAATGVPLVSVDFSCSGQADCVDRHCVDSEIVLVP